jgi:hypothetical protein
MQKVMIKNSLLDFKNALGINNFSKDLSETEFKFISIVAESEINDKTINLTTISDDLKERCEDLNCILLELIKKLKEPGSTIIPLDSYESLVSGWNLLLKNIDNFLSDKSNFIDKEVCKLIQMSFMMFLCIHNELNHKIPEGIDKEAGENTCNCLKETVKLFNNNFTAN